MTYAQKSPTPYARIPWRRHGHLAWQQVAAANAAAAGTWIQMMLQKSLLKSFLVQKNPQQSHHRLQQPRGQLEQFRNRDCRGEHALQPPKNPPQQAQRHRWMVGHVVVRQLNVTFSLLKISSLPSLLIILIERSLSRLSRLVLYLIFASRPLIILILVLMPLILSYWIKNGFVGILLI